MSGERRNALMPPRVVDAHHLDRRRREVPKNRYRAIVDGEPIEDLKACSVAGAALLAENDYIRDICSEHLPSEADLKAIRLNFRRNLLQQLTLLGPWEET